MCAFGNTLRHAISAQCRNTDTVGGRRRTKRHAERPPRNAGRHLERASRGALAARAIPPLPASNAPASCRWENESGRAAVYLYRILVQTLSLTLGRCCARPHHVVLPLPFWRYLAGTLLV